MKLEKYFVPAALVLTAVLAFVQISSVLDETQTWDEAIHLAAGLSYLRTGDFRMNPEHPALGKILSAMALAPYHVSLPLSHPSWTSRDETEFGNQFLYFNRVPADKILFAARTVTIVLTVLFALSLAFWTRRRFGASVALFALTLFVFDPNIIAHGRYVTTDLIGALFIFMACVLWGEYLLTKRTPMLAASGVALGLALVSKYSALFLLVVFPLLAAIRWGYNRRRGGRRLVLSLLIVATIALLVVAITYAPEVKTAVRHTWTEGLLSEKVSRKTLLGASLWWLGERLHLPAFSYLMGLGMAADRSTSIGPTYILGHIYSHGQWWYFPLAFVVKTPAGVLALLVLSAAIASVAIFRRHRGVPFLLVVLAAPPAVFFAFSMNATLNIGLRHILPVYPFLHVLIAYTVVRHGRTLLKPYIAPVLLGIVVLESALIYPYYLSFFNALAGGPNAGSKYLLDSNIDWGQDVKRLKRFMDTNHLDLVSVDIFGNAPLAYYGIAFHDLPVNPNDLAAIQRMDSVAAVSVTLLNGLYVEPNQYKWMRECRSQGKWGIRFTFTICGSTRRRRCGFSTANPAPA